MLQKPAISHPSSSRLSLLTGMIPPEQIGIPGDVSTGSEGFAETSSGPSVFEFGIASGDVTGDSVVLWTRVEPGSAVTWSVFDPNSGDVLFAGDATSDSGGFVHVGVSGLKPASGYEYEFATELGKSERGHFRTTPIGDRVRFAVVSCAKYNSGFFNAYAAIAARDDIDFVLHLGDYIYQAGQIPRGHQTPGIDVGRPFEPEHECVSPEDYDIRYAQYRRDEDLRSLHRRHAMLFTLDDHELADNAWIGGADDHFESDGPWERRLQAALNAWERWQPTLRRPASGEQLWSEQRLSSAADLFICDSRTARSDPDGPDNESKTVLGASQITHLEKLAATSERPWLVVAMPSKLLSVDAARGEESTRLAFEKLKLATPDGAPYRDRWDAYGFERDRILAALERAPAATLILSGDVHFAGFSRLASEAGLVVECVATSVTSPNLDDKMGWEPHKESRRYESRFVELVSELEWCDLDSHGYMVVELDVDRFRCEWWTVPTVRSRSGTSTLAHVETVNLRA